MTDRSQLGAVLLAAGPSSRLGQPKQLVRVEGQCLVRRAASLLLELDLGAVVVVTGCGSDEVTRELEGCPVTVAFNRDWERGMGGSISCGVRQLPRGLDGVLVTVCDQWRVQTADMADLISCWQTDISRICVACWDEGEAFVSGPPVIFSRFVMPELKYLHPDRGARQVVDLHMDRVEFVRMPNAAYDLDRPEDLAEITTVGMPSPSN
jgi:molybdenum cofactor cytidylyltransferase